MPFHRIFFTLVLLAAIWLVWSGLLKPLVLLLGVVSCVLVLITSWRMGMLRNELFGFGLFHRLPGYWLWLLREVVKSNIDVVRAVADPRHRVRPITVTVTDIPRRSLGKAILGNSITLTPGSLILDLVEDRAEVHCLTSDAAAAIATGEMQRRVRRLSDS